MKYIKIFDMERDEVFQSEIDDATAAKAGRNVEISDTPFKDIPMKSRVSSERERAAS